MLEFNSKFFENSELRGSTKVREVAFQEERQIVTVPIVLNKTDIYLLSMNVEIPLKRSQISYEVQRIG